MIKICFVVVCDTPTCKKGFHTEKETNEEAHQAISTHRWTVEDTPDGPKHFCYQCSKGRKDKK